MSVDESTSVMQSQWSPTSSAAARPRPLSGETGGVGTRLKSVVSAPGHLTLPPDQAGLKLLLHLMMCKTEIH